MKIAYLQCPTGIAGDMCLGALVDAGVPLDYLTTHLERLGIAQEYRLWTESVHRNGLRATKFHVDLVDGTGTTVDADHFTTFNHEHATPSADSAHSHPHPHPHPHRDVPTAPSLQIPNPEHPTLNPEHLTLHSHPHPHPHRDVPTAPSLRVSNPQPPNFNPSSPPLRHLPEIEHLILHAKLPPRAEAWSLAVFRQLAIAEGAVHGVPPEQVHFHEVGATDALVDIIGTCLGLDWLGIDRLVCSPLPTGGGTIRAAHGRLPVPTPAVLKLFELGQVPIYSNGIDRELVTPTGAAIATTLAHHFGAPPAMTLQQVGLGAGSSEFVLPNVLRLWIGEGEEDRRREAGFDVSAQPNGGRRQEAEGRRQEEKLGNQLHAHSHSSTPAHPHHPTEPILVLETQIDDLNPQAIGYVLEELLAAGAVDVFTQAIAMKKSRPGVLLTVICHPQDQERCEAIVFRETTTLGIRCTRQERQILPREMQTVMTAWGQVRVKVAWAAGRDRPPTNVQPEYEDCAAIARTHQIPWRQVQQQALAAWGKAGGSRQEAAGRPN